MITRLEMAKLTIPHLLYDPREERLWCVERVHRKQYQNRTQVLCFASNWMGDAPDPTGKPTLTINIVRKPYGFFRDMVPVGPLMESEG